jgi:hypothetical protein
MDPSTQSAAGRATRPGPALSPNPIGRIGFPGAQRAAYLRSTSGIEWLSLPALIRQA